jgi:fumarylacetoacetase
VTRWFDAGADPGFGVAHLPYGVFSVPGRPPGVGVRIAGRVLDLAPALGDPVFAAATLNPFLAQGPGAWRQARARITGLLGGDGPSAAVRPHLIPLQQVRMHLPFEVADYVDFYCSLEHASRLGQILRPGEPPLKPNWRRLPVGYHGRAGTVVVSGSPVPRPCGQRIPPGADGPVHGPSVRLDIEAEVGFVVGVPSARGVPVGTGALAAHVFGVVLVNDWSARDIQAFEYVPLGPFLGKSFATSIAAWVTPLAALEAARVRGPQQEPPVLGYLRRSQPWGLDLSLEVSLNGHIISRPPFAGMYWTADQMLAHLTVAGASLRSGDLFASGTVSGPEAGQAGSLIEITGNGAEPVVLPDGSSRSFLADGDTVTIGATAPGTAGEQIRLGPVTGTIKAAVGWPAGNMASTAIGEEPV